MTSVLQVALISLLIAQTLAKNGTCFFRNGAVADPNLWESCNPNSDGETHCCYKNNHICLSNKLCFDNLFNHVIEGACTDSSWSDSACPQYCKNNAASVVGDIRQCPGSNDNWVCGVNSTACINPFRVPQAFVDDRRAESQSVFVNIPAVYTSAARNEGAGAASGTVSTMTVTATGSGTPATTTGSQNSNARVTSAGSTQQDETVSKSSNIGIAAGLGIPLAISLLALAATVFLLIRANRRVQELRSQQQQHHSTYPVNNPMSSTTVGHHQIAHESPGQYRPPTELAKGATPPYHATAHEIDGTMRQDSTRGFQ